jgi:hypothetical protein
MKLTAIIETAVAGSVATGSIATPPGAETPRSRKKKPTRMVRRPVHNVMSESAFVRFDVSTAILFEDETTDNMRGTIDATNTKIDNAMKQNEVGKDEGYNVSTFGLQDADGNVVRVSVKREQANEFETRLNQILSDVDNKKEIAEIIYMLKSDFEILDVDWAEPITEDDPAPGEEGEGEDEFSLDGEEGEDGEGGLDDLSLDGEEGGEDGELDLGAGEDEAPSVDLQQSTVELLQQVIDLLKKETESRAADADLKTTKTDSLRQEEEIKRQQEIADMEKYEEKEKEEKKNERLFQRLAKFRSMKQGGEL